MKYESQLAGYTRYEFTFDPWTRTVFRCGSGPAVIIIHEIPGLHPLVVRFAGRVAQAGYTVFLPSLLGEPGRPVTAGYALAEMIKGVCIRREITFLARHQSSPITAWLRALARAAHQECGGPGVGAVGMCFSGGFALAMMLEPAVIAPVLSQPSLPVPLTKNRRSAIDLSPEGIEQVRQRLEREDLSILGLRFYGDPFVPNERFATYKRCFAGRFEAIEIDPSEAAPGVGGAKPHSVLTINLRDDDPLGPTKRAEARVIEFLGQRLASGVPVLSI